MKKSVNFSMFCDSFSESYRDNFSYEGKRALFDYLEQFEDDMGEEIELDTVGLCCDWHESDYDSIRREYGLGEDETDEEILDWLCDQTTVIEVTNDVVIYNVF